MKDLPPLRPTDNKKSKPSRLFIVIVVIASIISFIGVCFIALFLSFIFQIFSYPDQQKGIFTKQIAKVSNDSQCVFTLQSESGDGFDSPYVLSYDYTCSQIPLSQATKSIEASLERLGYDVQNAKHNTENTVYKSTCCKISIFPNFVANPEASKPAPLDALITGYSISIEARSSYD